MATRMSDGGHRPSRMALWGVAACVATLLACAVARGGEVVITAKDLTGEVGRRQTYAITTPEGQPAGELATAVIGKRMVGKGVLYREAVRFGQMRLQDAWVSVAEDGLVIRDSFGGSLPVDRCPLPLKTGMTFEYDSVKGKARVRVEGPETVETPAGEFTCLVIVRERDAEGKRTTQREWVTAGAGMVKAVWEGVVMTLVRTEAPPKPKPEEGTVVLSTFDTPDPLRSPLFPRGVWNGVGGQPAIGSVADIDPFVGGAAGTPFCLRWTYTTLGTWVSASIAPGGDPWSPVDLSKYAGVSFYIKGLIERPCSVSMQAKAADGEQNRFIHIPIQVTREWRKVVLRPDTHPQMNEIDTKRVHIVGLGDSSEEGASNVIWIDEIKLLLQNDKGEF